MTVVVEATYENGMLKLDRPLPLNDQQRVRVTIHTEESHVRKCQGMMGWTGDAATIEYLALSPDLDLEEGP